MYGQLIAILLCSSTIFQMQQLLLMKKKRELNEYKAIYMIKDYFISYLSSYTKHTKISSADQGIGSHYYFLYSRSEEKVVGVLGS